MGQRAQVAQGIVLAVGGSHHADAGRSAVHLVELAGEFHCVKLVSFLWLFVEFVNDTQHAVTRYGVVPSLRDTL